MEPLAGAGLEPVQESFGQKTINCSDTSRDSSWRKLVQLTDVPRTYTFTELSELLEVNESTLRKRTAQKPSESKYAPQKQAAQSLPLVNSDCKSFKPSKRQTRKGVAIVTCKPWRCNIRLRQTQYRHLTIIHL
jgi:hypothetical protein